MVRSFVFLTLNLFSVPLNRFFKLYGYMKQIFLDKNGHHNSPSSVFEKVLNQNISGCFNTTGHLTCVLNISSGLSFSSASYLPLNNVLCLRRVQ